MIIVEVNNMIVAIVGPTGVGKTKMSIELAKKYNAIIINCDAVQIYKGLDIGSAKVTEEEKEGIPHYLFDIKEVDEEYSIYNYQQDVRKLLEEHKDQNIILVGGTGLYLKAALYNYRLDYESSNNDYSNLEKNVIDSMVELGRKYPKCGYGPSFRHWIMSDEHKPYGSFGNGAAMRISSVGVVAKDINEIKRLSAIITNVSHNHKDSIDGSEATAVAIHMALNGKSKDDIKEYINNNYFGIYDLRKDSMKPQIFHINCVETVKQSIGAFLDSNDFEDAIRNAIALGGDSDTIAAITGGIAAAYYGIPEDMCNKALNYLDEYLIDIHDKFYKQYQE